MQEVRLVDDALCVTPAENTSTVEVRNNVAIDLTCSSNSANQSPMSRVHLQFFLHCNVKSSLTVFNPL